MTADEPAKPKSKRRWHQYSLRTLLILVTLFAVACSWFAVKMQQARRQREAVEYIRNKFGTSIIRLRKDSIRGFRPQIRLWNMVN